MGCDDFFLYEEKVSDDVKFKGDGDLKGKCLWINDFIGLVKRGQEKFEKLVVTSCRGEDGFFLRCQNL